MKNSLNDILTQFMYDLFMKYVNKLPQKEFHLFLKKIQKELSANKIQKVLDKYLQERNLPDLRHIYKKEMTEYLVKLNTYTNTDDNSSFTDLLFNVFHKCISLFSKYNQHRDLSKHNLHIQIKNIIKQQFLLLLPIQEIIKENIKDNSEENIVEYSFKNYSNNDSSDNSIDITVKLPQLHDINFNDYIKDSGIETTINKLENKSIELELSNKKHVRNFYKNLV